MRRAVLCVLLALWPGLASGSALMIDARPLEETAKNFPTCAEPAPPPFRRTAIEFGFIDIAQVQPHALCVVLRDANGPVHTLTLPNHVFTGGYLGDVIQPDGYVFFALYFSAGWFEHVAVHVQEGKLVVVPMPMLQGLGRLLIKALDAPTTGGATP